MRKRRKVGTWESVKVKRFESGKVGKCEGEQVNKQAESS